MHPPRFLHPILTHPQEDAPRLDYADWLSECGNPLGEFIRLQCAIASLSPGAPSFQLERREQQLLCQHQAQWSILSAASVVWCSFRRGFIEEVLLTERQMLTYAEHLFRQAPVQDVHLQITRGRLDELPELSFLCHTIFLDLSAQPLGDEGADCLADTPMLGQVHGLNLGSTFLGDAGLDSLIDSPDLGNLRELYLNDNPITDESIRRFVLTPIAEQLEVLDVRNTRISPEAVGVLRHILGDRCLVA